MERKLILKKPYFPSGAKINMENVGNLEHSRQDFFKNKPANLNYLLGKRYFWMNEFLGDKKINVEVGSGAGLLKEYIKVNVQLTEYKKYHWINQEVNALNMPYENDSIDVIISSHMIHHLSQPIRFLREAHRVLKKDGYLLIQEINTSLLMRLLIRIIKIEGWSYDIDVFDNTAIISDPDDPWSANNAVPELLFSDINKFEKNVEGFKIKENQLCECFIFLISGGVTAKRKTLNLPQSILKAIDKLDEILISLFPALFALGRRVVLQKK